jgi:hypothetical protein
MNDAMFIVMMGLDALSCACAVGITFDGLIFINNEAHVVNGFVGISDASHILSPGCHIHEWDLIFIS